MTYSNFPQRSNTQSLRLIFPYLILYVFFYSIHNLYETHTIQKLFVIKLLKYNFFVNILIIMSFTYSSLFLIVLYGFYYSSWGYLLTINKKSSWYNLKDMNDIVKRDLDYEARENHICLFTNTKSLFKPFCAGSQSIREIKTNCCKNQV